MMSGPSAQLRSGATGQGTPALSGRQLTGRTSVQICETRAGLREGLTRELRAQRLEPVLTDPETLEAEAGQGGGTMRPLLLPDTDTTPRLLGTLRRAGRVGPILVYQDFRRSGRVCELLDAGADCVMTLPLKGPEVGARILALLRRAHCQLAPEVRVGTLRVPLDRSSPRVGDVSLSLPEAEATLLRQLALHLDRPVSRELLYETLYDSGDHKPFPPIIDRYICNLRRRIGSVLPEGAGLIATVPGYGYRLLASPPGGTWPIEVQATARKQIA
jgi:DNA-binding response OmpR family regulator